MSDSPARPAVRSFHLQAEHRIDERCHIVEISNSDADPGLSVARARVEPGDTTRWHRLAHTTERYAIVSGHGRVELGDQPPREVGPGDVVIIPPGCRQRIANTGGVDLVFLAICTPRFRPENYSDAEGE